MRREAGVALIWAMLVLLLVGSTSTLFLARSRGSLRDAETDAARLAAFHAAEGGLAHARHALATDPDFAGATLAIGACEVETTVERAANGWRVVAVARPGGATVSATLHVADGLPEIARWARR